MGSLDLDLAELVHRLRKEVARAERGTVAVGGITKAGNDLEKLLKNAAAIVLASLERMLDDELSRRRVPGGAGTYLNLLLEAPTSGVNDEGDRSILVALARDATLVPYGRSF